MLWLTSKFSISSINTQDPPSDPIGTGSIRLGVDQRICSPQTSFNSQFYKEQLQKYKKHGGYWDPISLKYFFESLIRTLPKLKLYVYIIENFADAIYRNSFLQRVSSSARNIFCCAQRRMDLIMKLPNLAFVLFTKRRCLAYTMPSFPFVLFLLAQSFYALFSPCLFCFHMLRIKLTGTRLLQYFSPLTPAFVGLYLSHGCDGYVCICISLWWPFPTASSTIL